MDRSPQATVQGIEFQLDYYENPAYTCGRNGLFGFLVVQKPGQGLSPLWVLMRGGGIGYYDDTGTYHGNEKTNDAEGAQGLAKKLLGSFVGAATSPKDKFAGRRMLEGARFMMPSLCDHDAYAGIGTPYPNNPNHGKAGDTVDGLLATMAAVDFTVNGHQDAKAPKAYPTDLVFVQGSSAGSLGAYHVVRAFRDAGIRLNGAVLDSFILNRSYSKIVETGCTPPAKADAAFDYQQVDAKLDRLGTEPGLWINATIAAGFEVPIADVYASGDPYCCGDGPVAAVAKGFATNCDYVHAELKKLIAATPAAGHVQIRLDDKRHVVLNSVKYTAIADQVDAWLKAVLAKNPTPPWP